MAAETRVVGSAIRAAANPDDPGQAFASAFLADLFKQIDPNRPVTQTAFDDDGFLMPGSVDPSLPVVEQMAQLRDHLQRQGLSAEEAGWRSMRCGKNLRVPCQSRSQALQAGHRQSCSLALPTSNVHSIRNCALSRHARILCSTWKICG